jgi:hypothetical protein
MIAKYVQEYRKSGITIQHVWDKGLSLLNKSGINWTTWTYKTTARYGNWGIYHHAETVGKINLEHTSFDSIKKFWSSMDAESPNTELIKVLRKQTHRQHAPSH